MGFEHHDRSESNPLARVPFHWPRSWATFCSSAAFRAAAAAASSATDKSFYVVSTQYWSPNTKYFYEKISLRTWATTFDRNTPFFKLVFFPYFLPNPDTRMCVSTIGSFWLFRKQKTNLTLVKTWFIVFFSTDFRFLCLFQLFMRETIWETSPPSPIAEKGYKWIK